MELSALGYSGEQEEKIVRGRLRGLICGECINNGSFDRHLHVVSETLASNGVLQVREGPRCLPLLPSHPCWALDGFNDVLTGDGGEIADLVASSQLFVLRIGSDVPQYYRRK